MGKSKYCFGMFTCADRDSASADVLLPPENEASSDKTWWSFRKRLSRHRVLSKNAALEPESGLKFSKDIYVSEPASIQTKKEELAVGSALSTTASDSELSSIVARIAINNNGNLKEHAVIIIQAAIRGHLAKGKHRKIKSVIKLQAAMRGHLVRMQAVGTLCCIRVISKMQAIVRDRVACQLQEKLAEIEWKDVHRKGRFCSTKKLLSNRFAQKLLASTPNTRIIRIKCDPSISDSAWKWLERWTAIIRAEAGEEKEHNLIFFEKVDVKISEPSNKVKQNCSSDSKLEPRESVPSFENVSGQNSRSEDIFQSQSDAQFSASCFNIKEKDEQNQKTQDFSAYKIGSKGNNLINTIKTEHTGSSEMEVPKPTMRSRRPCNPTFVAAQSKFKELSAISQVKTITETGLTENLISNDPIVQLAASECGTEISISSTLDSPDRSETECGEIILEISSLDKHNYDVSTSSDKCNEFQMSESNKIDEALIYPLDSSPPTASDVQCQDETTDYEPDKLSIERTPRSQTAVLETYGTPSEVSVNARNGHKDSNTAPESNRRLSSTVMSKSVTSGSTESEHLSNDSKSGKKRRFTAVSRIDLDDEPRMSYSNNSSLPSYMQATKSAKAKVHTSISPKSSPDLHDKDDHIKKKHALPIGIEKQDSTPPKQQSTRRAQHNSKGNATRGSHTCAERRWQR